MTTLLMRAVEDPCMSSPPRKKSATSTSSVVNDVINVRDSV